MVGVSKTRPRLLDLFCGAGGCSVGYYRAGFEVVGVDIEPHGWVDDPEKAFVFGGVEPEEARRGS